MATIQALIDSTAALSATVARIDPAQLDPIKAVIDAQTAAIEAVLPPQ